MGRVKRNVTLVISSSDDEDFLVKSSCKPASVPRTNYRKKPKEASLSNSCPRSRKVSDPSDFDEIKQFCKEIDEGITRFKVSTGCGRSNYFWVDKYIPHSLEELAVHKKKVEEVKTFFQERLVRSNRKSCNHVLLIAGPAGVGKSVTVHAIASHFGAIVYEWNTPTPTIWHEHVHNTHSGLRYMSKLEEFEHFVERIRKYGLISSSSVGVSQTSVILLIDDLPVVNGQAAYRRLHRCLRLLVQSVCVPTAILITEYGKADSTDFTMRYWDDIQLSLQDAGACKVTFNPITVNSMRKALLRICREEQHEVSAEQIELIAKASGGDIRNAITSLQYFCLKPHDGPSLSFHDNISSCLKEGSDKMVYLSNGPSLSFGRDDTISLFHALGKFLHNKRDTENPIAADRDTIVLKEKFVRLPLKMNAPEMVLCQAHGQTRPIADFLHENVLDFMSEEAMNDAWVVESYLSDADLLLASLNGMRHRNFDAENAIQSAAASIAVRGTLFGNAHQVSSRWHAIRRPKLWEVEQTFWQNKVWKNELIEFLFLKISAPEANKHMLKHGMEEYFYDSCQMVNQRCDSYNSLNLYDLTVAVTELKPALKWIGYRTSKDEGAYEASSDDMVEDDVEKSILTEEDRSEDEIEDW